MSTKFQKIFDLIEIDIRDGVYNDTRKLLSEDEYVTRYAVSRDTIRRAIDLLITRGYCYPVQGKGVFLRRHKIAGAANLEYIRGLTVDLYPRKVTSKVLVFTQVKAEGYVAAIMNCPLDTPLTHYERIRYADNEPVCFESIYFISAKVPLSSDVLNGSVYEHLRSILKVNLLMIDHTITAIKLDEKEAEYLGLNVGDPGLCFENLGMDRKGEIIQYGRTVNHYQRIRNLKMVSHL
jgi:GntR family transcriptional regulator, transcriptional regulator of bglA